MKGWSTSKMRRGKGVLDLEGFGGWLQGSEVIPREPSSESAFQEAARARGWLGNTRAPGLSPHGWCCWAHSLSTLGSLLAMQHLGPTQTH